MEPVPPAAYIFHQTENSPNTTCPFGPGPLNILLWGIFRGSLNTQNVVSSVSPIYFLYDKLLERREPFTYTEGSTALNKDLGWEKPNSVSHCSTMNSVWHLWRLPDVRTTDPHLRPAIVHSKFQLWSIISLFCFSMLIFEMDIPMASCIWDTLYM